MGIGEAVVHVLGFIQEYLYINISLLKFLFFFLLFPSASILKSRVNGSRIDLFIARCILVSPKHHNFVFISYIYHSSTTFVHKMTYKHRTSQSKLFTANRRKTEFEKTLSSRPAVYHPQSLSIKKFEMKYKQRTMMACGTHLAVRGECSILPASTVYLSFQ